MSVSTEAMFLEDLYRDWTLRMAAQPDLPLTQLRGLFDEWQSATREPENVSYRSEKIAGVDGIWCYPASADTAKVIVYLHGGGFMCGSTASHRKLAAHLARSLRVTAVVIDYRRAPEYSFPAPQEDTAGVFRELIARGFDPADVYFAGDSAGGSIAVSTALRLRDEHAPLPGGIICFSPWLDLELTGESLMTSAATDFLVPSPSGPELIAAYVAGTTPLTDPLINPMHANFTGFPRLYINVGSGEALRDDAVRFHELATSHGVDSTLTVARDMQHVFLLLAGRAVEADDELERIARWFHGENDSAD